MSYYVDAFKNYINFSGRARRKAYWMFFLCNVVAAFVLGLVSYYLKFPLLGTLYSLAVLCPGLALSIRRLHDTGRSGFCLFIVFVPLIGSLWLLILMCLDSQPGENKYGPNPKENELI